MNSQVFPFRWLHRTEVELMTIETTPLHLVMSYLNYSGPILEGFHPIKSVEITQNCVSDDYLFFHFMKQGFLVNFSPFFRGFFFRVRYYNYADGRFWP